MEKFKTNWIPYIVIGVLIIVLYFVWNSKGDEDENQIIKDAEARIELLEQQVVVKDSIIDVRTAERDSAHTAVKVKVVNDKKDIEHKYDKVKSDIVNLSDDASVELLGKNLGAK